MRFQALRLFGSLVPTWCRFDRALPAELETGGLRRFAQHESHGHLACGGRCCGYGGLEMFVRHGAELLIAAGLLREDAHCGEDRAGQVVPSGQIGGIGITGRATIGGSVSPRVTSGP